MQKQCAKNKMYIRYSFIHKFHTTATVHVKSEKQGSFRFSHAQHTPSRMARMKALVTVQCCVTTVVSGCTTNKETEQKRKKGGVGEGR